MDDTRAFTPALGLPALTNSYDRVLAFMTREHQWRSQLVSSIAPRAGEVIVDIGSGTGSLAIMLKTVTPDSRVIAMDPDPQARRLAEHKARKSEADINFITAMGADAADAVPHRSIDKVVVCLVLHQCRMAEKRAILSAAHAMLKPGGRLFIADYGLQPDPAMKVLFNLVRLLDGYSDTRANKNGQIPILMGQAGFGSVQEAWRIRTPTGAISHWTAQRTSA
ncbi:class I SAM-dependent methyltransferase [Brevundimonas naejangsanensis]|uniref:class I SAM-dependent methyltransferase n=1 Tax=Brevundimonas naejangsanensis TaxID=588932 RepID=UPI00320BA911